MIDTDDSDDCIVSSIDLGAEELKEENLFYTKINKLESLMGEVEGENENKDVEPVLGIIPKDNEKTIKDVEVFEDKLTSVTSLHNLECAMCHQHIGQMMTGWKGNVCHAKFFCPECKVSIVYSEPYPLDTRCYELFHLQRSFNIKAIKEIKQKFLSSHRTSQKKLT